MIFLWLLSYSKAPERMVWQRDWMLLSSVDFRMIIRRIQTGFFWRQAWYSKLIAVPVQNFDLDFRWWCKSESSDCWRAIRMILQYRFMLSITSESSLEALIQNKPLCANVPPECHLEVWSVTYCKNSHKAESGRRNNGSWHRKLGHWP